MKLFDSHVMLGSYPYRMVKGTDAPTVHGLLRGCGVERALVSSLPAVFYRDVMEGNLSLLREIAELSDFFVPAAVLNPNYPGCHEDFARCRELGFKAIRLYPAQHGYYLGDDCCVKLLRESAGAGLPVSVPASIENPLQLHRLDAKRYVEEAELLSAVRAVPEAVILFHNAATHLYAKVLAEAALGFKPNVYFDFQRVDFIAQNAMSQLYEYAGADHVIFGTGCPMHVPDVQLVKLALWRRFRESDPDGAAWDNLSALL